ncbi:inhibitor of apoptosis protein 2 [Anticarsia gemmatalis multiple nucleopolyhedrovirus]|uniref:Inhibitor of apoptosis protein 2 n=1 Tax=Anticarsia gemmatalis multiple nucleopolyhedrovirus TaxID=268591 RepID=A0A0S3J1W7_9ABAC|nr:inhibitor of apoptosis protein 2 [Anticarsia gemmatalis multiple nucleopolyhedrovirus]YP_803464.1 inhibitor of apoptosis protein 2 [Anticarsia gemmatalis nucleopolyhedrovirus]ABI13853.1 inhibitor of apoptosis protein 2 [Anticarsia gemmatalis multiple nucleopolyhedrovirus]ALR69897.1 inhibitor of apoptosis protein 2 [Anticarsia gemmatalis multiple nucleopolyhedrovirus]ALR70212.1 inhibitor of apoptosis protein 2 [Anticarsia gemmatalis multiple nucleopolyhedrovirus]ALR70839.1 inhibitor of apopt
MDLKKFNFLILSTHGRVKTMTPLLLDNVQKMDLAKTGFFFHNNMLKCIGCRTTMDKIDTKRVKRHTYSDYCISATNALLANESLRKQSFCSFKWARRQFASQPRVIDMLSRRGFYCFGKRLRCAGCKAVVAYESVDAAQRGHDAVCAFRHVVDVNLDESTFKVLQADLSPPRLERVEPSAPQADSSSSSIVSECKVCFSNEKSVCFLPCRHLAVCATCSPRCKKCCVCNGKITSRIETLPQ